MKRVILLALFLIVLFPLASAECDLSLSMLNQDPYPAVPGESIKVVFQLEGIESFDCGRVFVEIKESHPFSVDPSSKKRIEIMSGTFMGDYESFLLAPFKLRVSENALDGNNNLTVYYGKAFGGNFFEKDFGIEVDNPLTDFEVLVYDYSEDEKKLIFDLINIGETSANALTFEIPEQDSILIYGNSKEFIGDIDSEEDERIIFEADVLQENIKIILSYTDQVNVRRTLKKTVYVDSEDFSRIIEEGSSFSASKAFFIGLLIPIIIFLVLRYFKGKKRKKSKRGLKGTSGF